MLPKSILNGSLDGTSAGSEPPATLDGMKELSIANVGGTNYLIGLSTGHADNLVVFEIESRRHSSANRHQG